MANDLGRAALLRFALAVTNLLFACLLFYPNARISGFGENVIRGVT